MAKSAMAAPYITAPIQWTLHQSGKAIAQMCLEPVSGNSTCMINGQTGIGEQLTGLNSVVSLLIGRGKDDDPVPTDQSSPHSRAARVAAPSPISLLIAILMALCIYAF
jgi:hypothetical protein